MSLLLVASCSCLPFFSFFTIKNSVSLTRPHLVDVSAMLLRTVRVNDGGLRRKVS